MKVQGILFVLWFIVVGIWMTNQFRAAQLRADKERKALKDSSST